MRRQNYKNRCLMPVKYRFTRNTTQSCRLNFHLDDPILNASKDFASGKVTCIDFRFLKKTTQESKQCLVN